MNNAPMLHLRRRKFLSSASLLISGCCLSALPSAPWPSRQTEPELPEELTAPELEAAKKSTMARDLDNHFGKGYSCAESLLMVGLRYLHRPEELVWLAAGFGGGMQHRDACGFLTAGIMNLGMAAGRLKMSRSEAKLWSTQKVNTYWSWWAAQAPLRCANIKKPGTSSRVCRRLGLLAAAEVERLITSAQVPA